jgi:hypothetical protein
LRLAELAGFREITVELTLRASSAEPQPWELAMKSAGNPNIPSLAEAMERIFTDAERAHFEAIVRPLVEAGGRMDASAVAHVRATKDHDGGVRSR